jgi:hypothetical protein
MSTFFKKTQVTIQPKIVKAKFSESIKPTFTLSGDWIKNAGFEIGETLSVEVVNGKITLSKPS